MAVQEAHLPPRSWRERRKGFSDSSFAIFAVESKPNVAVGKPTTKTHPAARGGMGVVSLDSLSLLLALLPTSKAEDIRRHATCQQWISVSAVSFSVR